MSLFKLTYGGKCKKLGSRANIFINTAGIREVSRLSGISERQLKHIRDTGKAPESCIDLLTTAEHLWSGRVARFGAQSADFLELHGEALEELRMLLAFYDTLTHLQKDSGNRGIPGVFGEVNTTLKKAAKALANFKEFECNTIRTFSGTEKTVMDPSRSGLQKKEKTALEE